MNDLIYVGAVLVGAGTLLVEAFRNFNSQTGQHPFELHPILKEVEIRNLCTTGEIIAGFVFYAIFYLIAYAIVLGSAEVFQLLLSASNARSEIGATDNDFLRPGDPLSLSSTDYGKPILVSALLIACLSIGAVKPIEATMRGLAHRLAGIPRGVYRVIENLRAAEYEEFMEGYPAELTTKFLRKAKTVDPKSEFEAQRRDIANSLIAIDCLSVATDVNNRTLYFPLYRMTELTALSNRLEQEIGDLNEAIGEIGKADQEDGSESPKARETSAMLSEIERRAALTRSNTMAIFAVLFVRNNRSIFSQKRRAGNGTDFPPGRRDKKSATESPIEKIKVHIQEAYNIEQNSFAMSLFLALIIGAFLIFITYHFWHSLVAENMEFSQLLSIAAGAAYKCTATDRACLINAYMYIQTPINITATVWDVISSGAVVVVSVFFALVGREVRLEQQSWQTDWKFHRFPFLRLLGMSFIPAMLSVFAAASIDLAKLAWGVDFRLTQTQIIFWLEQSGAFLTLQFGAGLILSFAALVIMDKHHSLRFFWTIGIGIASAALYVLYMRLVIFLSYGVTLSQKPSVAWFSPSWRDAFILASVPVLFLILFAAMLEYSEGGRRIGSGGGK